MSRSHDLGSCPSNFALERLRVGELDEGDAVARHARLCPDCAVRVEALATPAPPFPLDAVWRAGRLPQPRPHVGGRSSPGAPARRWALGRRLLFALTATTAVAAGVVTLRAGRPAPPADLVKGGAFSLGVIARARGTEDVKRIASGARLSPGDRLRFEVSTTWTHGYVAILSLDAAGVVSSLAPPEGQAVEIRAGRRVLLDDAVELDETMGPERIELVGCREAVSVAQLAAGARAGLASHGGDPSKVGLVAPGCAQETFWIEKVKP